MKPIQNFTFNTILFVLIIINNILNTTKIVFNKNNNSIYKLIKDIKAKKTKTIYVDGWNVIITIDSYYKGKPVFISTDGFIRDVTESGSSYKITDLTYQIIDKLLKLKSGSIFFKEYLFFYFEDNVSFSLIFKKEIENKFNFKNIKLSKNVDKDLIKKSIVATSDSQIIDKVKYPIDLVKIYLKKYHKNYIKKIIKL